MRYWNLLPIVFALLCVGSSATAQTTLRWKFAKDQPFVVDCTQQTEVETSVNNKPRRAFLEMTMQLAWQVESVDDAGVATIAQSFTRLQLKTTAPDAEPVVYDSASTSKPIGIAREIAAGIAPLIGAKFTVKIDPRGNVLDVVLSDETQQALDKLPENSQLKPLLSKDGLTNLFRLGDGQLPEKAVSAGDTWPADSETKTPYGQLKQQGTYTYVGTEAMGEKKLDKIELQSTATLATSADAPIKLQGQEQTKTGTLLFDSGAGRVISSETKLISKSIRPFRDTQIHVRITSTTKLEITP